MVLSVPVLSVKTKQNKKMTPHGVTYAKPKSANQDLLPNMQFQPLLGMLPLTIQSGITWSVVR